MEHSFLAPAEASRSQHRRLMIGLFIVDTLRHPLRRMQPTDALEAAHATIVDKAEHGNTFLPTALAHLTLVQRLADLDAQDGRVAWSAARDAMRAPITGAEIDGAIASYRANPLQT